jgi:hypothetical protein
MLEKISRLAEKAATNISVSRRGFMGRLGKAAVGAAGVVGGLLALSDRARAGQTLYSCDYTTNQDHRDCYGTRCGTIQSCGRCPSRHCCGLVRMTAIGTC